MSFNHAMLFLESACGFGKLINDPAGTKRVDLNAGKRRRRGRDDERDGGKRRRKRRGKRRGKKRKGNDSIPQACVCV